MRRLVCAILLACASASPGGVALADEQTERTIAESALRQAALPRDYGLVQVFLRFSATRNATRSRPATSSRVPSSS